MLCVFILTLMKPANLPEVSVNDKLAHLFAFIVLAFLADFSFNPSQLKALKTLMLFAFGVVIEISQYFTSWRSADWQDAIADLLGILSYWLIAPLIMKWAFWRKD